MKKIAICQPRVVKKPSFAEQYAIELDELADLDVDVFETPNQDSNTFAEAMTSAHAVITSWGIRFDAKLIQTMQQCQIISVGSIGVDSIDITAATNAGIVITNVPDIFIDEVADHCLALLLACARRLKKIDILAHDSNTWKAGRLIMEQFPRLRGQTLGLLSFGSTARAVARRAKAFGLRLMAYDPYVSEVEMIQHEVEPVNFKTLLQQADFLSLHTVLNSQTRHIINSAALKLMKPSAVLVNTARGGLIDEESLAVALRNKQISAAGLDVMEQEPPTPDNKLLQMDNVLISPHCASSSNRMRPATRRRAAQEVALVLRGLWPMSCVNPQVLPGSELERWQPYSMQKGPSR